MFIAPKSVYSPISSPIRSVGGLDYSMWSGQNDGAMNFVTGQYRKGGVLITPAALDFTSVHSTDQLLLNASGAYDTVGPNIIPRNNLGHQRVPTSINDFVNSDAPVTQTVTVVDATIYTISMVGTGSIVLSGAGAGTVTAGSLVTLTTAGTALTCTVSGSLIYAQVEKGSFATPPIVSGGTPATRPGNLDAVSGLSLNTGLEFCIIADIKEPGSNYKRILQFDDGTSLNRVLLFYVVGNLKLAVTTNNILQVNINLGPWQQGLVGISGSVGTNFAHAEISGGAVVAPITTGVLYPTMTKVSPGGNSYDVTENIYDRTPELYWRTDVTPSTLRTAELSRFVAQRKAVYV